MEKQNVLRNKEMMKAFEDLYAAHLGLQRINLESFRESSLSFFDDCEKRKKKYEFHRRFFVKFTNLWQNFMYWGNIKKAEWVWKFALDLAYEWEKNNNKRIHKGTPYYFYGVTNIIAGDIPYGFLLMHQAFREDQKTDKTDFPKTPAYSFITFDYEKTQYFQQKVREIADFLDDRIKDYVSKRESNLNLDDFKQKFLENKGDPLIIDVVYYFVYSLFQLHKLFNIKEEVTENKFASMLEVNTIFDLCLVLDNILKIKDYKNKYLSQHINSLSNKLDFRYTKYIKVPNEEIKNNNREFKTVLKELLESNYKNAKLTPIEEDFAISLICRNYGAHQLRNTPSIYENFKDIIQRILNSIFYSVEKLYS